MTYSVLCILFDNKFLDEIEQTLFKLTDDSSYFFLFPERNKPRVRGPPLCVRVTVVQVKNEFMTKSFFVQKIT